MYIFAKVSVALYAGGVVLQTFADINLQAAAVGLVCVSGLYVAAVWWWSACRQMAEKL